MLNKRLFLGRMVMAGFTQKSLAEAIHISKNTLNNKINGRSFFDTREIEEICQLLHIETAEEKAEIFLSQSSQKWDRCRGE